MKNKTKDEKRKEKDARVKRQPSGVVLGDVVTVKKAEKKEQKPLMACGHSANATHDGKPACAICCNIKEGWDKIAEQQPKLKGRMARCSYCESTEPSNTNLAFFKYRPDKEFDGYYCGCRGWN